MFLRQIKFNFVHHIRLYISVLEYLDSVCACVSVSMPPVREYGCVCMCVRPGALFHGHWAHLRDSPG
jgi:hypothetical protein